MGWIYQHKPHGETTKQNLIQKFTFEYESVKSTVLDCAIVNLKTAYLAVEQIEKASGARGLRRRLPPRPPTPRPLQLRV